MLEFATTEHIAALRGWDFVARRRARHVAQCATVVKFRGDKVGHKLIDWDQASVLVQIGATSAEVP